MAANKQYIEGFNDGYLLTKYEPGLLAKIIQGLHATTDYLQGLFSGKEEYELEQLKRQENELKNIRDKIQTRDRDFERD